MKKLVKRICLLLTIMSCIVFTHDTSVSAKSSLGYHVTLNRVNGYTIPVGINGDDFAEYVEHPSSVGKEGMNSMSFSVYQRMVTEEDVDAAGLSSEFYDNMTFTSSDPEVILFTKNLDEFAADYVKARDEGRLDSFQAEEYLASSIKSDWWHGGYMVGLKEGSSIITAKSTIKVGKKKYTISESRTINVKEGFLTTESDIFYDHHTYQMKLISNDKVTSYTSSNKNVATVDASGCVKTLKKGKVTISCKTKKGKRYDYKLDIRQRGLSANKLTVFYNKFGFICYPVVAEGIDVKSWTVSSKICKLEKHDNWVMVYGKKAGKCKLTCTAKNGKKYTCNLTILPELIDGNKVRDESILKSTGWYKHINSIQDYGNVIVVIKTSPYSAFDIENGHSYKDVKDFDPKKFLEKRFPNQLSNGYEVEDVITYASMDVCRKRNGRYEFCDIEWDVYAVEKE